MKKAFLINIVFLLATNLIIKPFYLFGIDRTVQNILGSQTYGIYITLLNLCLLFQIVSDFGIRYLNNRDIAQDPELFPKYFSNIVVFKVLAAIGFTLVCYIAAFILNYDTYYLQLLSILILAQLLTDFLEYIRSNVSGLHYYFRNSLLSILDKLLMIILCGTLIWANPFDAPFQIEWFIYAQLLAYSISIIIGLLFIKDHLKGIRFEFDLVFFKKIIKKTSGYALSVFLMSIYLRSDVLIMERILPDGSTEAGLYYQAYRLISAANMIGVLFAGLLLPMFAKQIKEKNSIQELLVFSFQLLFSMLIVASINIIFFREQIMVSLYDEGNLYSGNILGILILSFIATGSIYIFNTLLIANENLKKLNVLYFIAMVVNLVFNFILIPKYEAIGAAISTLITQFLVWFGGMYLTVVIFKLKTNYKLLGKLLLFILVIIACNLLVINWTTWSWLIQLIVITILGVLATFLLKLIDLKMLLKIIQERE